MPTYAAIELQGTLMAMPPEEAAALIHLLEENHLAPLERRLATGLYQACQRHANRTPIRISFLELLSVLEFSPQTPSEMETCTNALQVMVRQLYTRRLVLGVPRCGVSSFHILDQAIWTPDGLALDFSLSPGMAMLVSHLTAELRIGAGTRLDS